MDEPRLNGRRKRQTPVAVKKNSFSAAGAGKERCCRAQRILRID